jgi:hypothetical protein
MVLYILTVSTLLSITFVWVNAISNEFFHFRFIFCTILQLAIVATPIAYLIGRIYYGDGYVWWSLIY